MEGYDFRAIDKIKQNLTLRLEFILTEISTTGRFQAEKSNYLFSNKKKRHRLSENSRHLTLKTEDSKALDAF